MKDRRLPLVLSALTLTWMSFRLGGKPLGIPYPYLYGLLGLVFSLFLMELTASGAFAVFGTLLFAFWMVPPKEAMLLLIPIALVFLLFGVVRNWRHWKWILSNLLIGTFFGFLFAFQVGAINPAWKGSAVFARSPLQHLNHPLPIVVLGAGLLSWATLLYFLREKQKKEQTKLTVLDIPATRTSGLSRQPRVPDQLWLFVGLFLLVFASVSSWSFLVAMLCFRIVFEVSRLKKVMGLFWNYIIPIDWLLLLGAMQLLSWKGFNSPNLYMNSLWQVLLQSLYACTAGALVFNSLLNVMSPPIRQAPKRPNPAPGSLLHP